MMGAFAQLAKTPTPFSGGLNASHMHYVRPRQRLPGVVQFQEHWEKGAASDPDNWPKAMTLGEWNEQFEFWVVGCLAQPPEVVA